MFCPLHFHMVWDNLGTLLPSLSPPPLPLPLLYLLFLLFKDTSISWCEVSFLTALPRFIFLCAGTHDIHALILGRAITGLQAFTGR